MQTIQKARLRSGQFAPGQSGNPGGRPKDEHRVAELARSYTVEAIDTLVELMRDGKDERVRGTAAQALLDRGWGKAKVEVVAGAEGSYLDESTNCLAGLLTDHYTLTVPSSISLGLLWLSLSQCRPEACASTKRE